MKDRLYKKHVIDGNSNFAEMLKSLSCENRNKLFKTLICFIFCIAVAVWATIYISPLTTYFFAPAIAAIFSRQFYLRYKEFTTHKPLFSDYCNYSIWMKNQLYKDNPRLNEHLRDAIETYKKYAPNNQYNPQDIINTLQLHIKGKNENQIIISVLCGLLFISGNKDYRDIIYKAKYKSGPAGSMVLKQWIMYFDGSLPANVTFDQLKIDFLNFWNNKV